jgi:hypothetical protein
MSVTLYLSIKDEHLLPSWRFSLHRVGFTNTVSLQYNSLYKFIHAIIFIIAPQINNKFKTVQPVPAPFSTNEETSNNINDGGNNQKLTLFNLGNAISTAPIWTGRI